MNVAVELVDAHVAAGRRAKAAILCGDRTITYAELAAEVNRFANVLVSLAVRMEERVVILLPDAPEWAFAFFGAIKRGAVAVPLNTMLKAADYQYLINDCRARVVVVAPTLACAIAEVRGRLPLVEHVLVAGDCARDKTGDPHGFARLADAMEAASDQFAAADTSKDDMAFWLYSSGTTGFPKGAVHLHHDMLVEAEYYARQTIGLREDDVSFSVAKLFFAYGLGNGLYFPLYTGGTTVLLPDRPTPETVYATVDRYQPTVYFGVPTSYAAMMHLAEKTDRRSLGRVRMCVSAGEALPQHLYEKWHAQFGVEILDGIGSTEILHIFISNRPGQARPGSTGQIVPGYEARIVDDHDNQLPPRQVGTLLIKGDSIASGYWGKHEQSKDTFRGQWINTHDKFLMDEDGYFWYAGRADDMIKVSGQAVWPADVEGLIQRHPAVLESGVVGVADPDGLLKPVAYVVLKDGREPTDALAREIQQFVKNAAAPHKYPRAVLFVDVLPKTATGKIQRYLLRQTAAEQAPLHRQEEKGSRNQ